MSPRAGGAWAAGAVALATIYNLPNFLYPLFEDTALFALVGYWLDHGVLPYIGIVDQKPPLLYWLMALATGLLGTSDTALRLFELLFIVATAAATGAVAARSRVPGARAFAIALTGMLLSALVWGLPDRGQSEVYQSCFAAVGVWLLLRALDSASSAGFVASGVALSATAWIKPQGALLPVLLVFALGVLLRRDRRRVARLWLGLAAGAAALGAVLVGWMAYRGILGAFWTVMVHWNGGYLTQVPAPGPATTLAHSAPHHIAGWLWAAMWVAAALAIARGGLRFAIVLACWALAALLQFHLGRYLFDYHKIPMIPPLACGLGVGVSVLVERVRRVPLAPAALGALVLCAPLVSSSYRDDWSALAAWTAGLGSVTDLRNPRGAEAGYFDWMTQVRLGRYVAARTAPGDRVQVLGRAAVFYLVAKRRPASRFVITSGAFDTRRRSQKEVHALLVHDLERNPPKYLMIRTTDAFPWFGLASADRLLATDPPLQAWIRRHYVDVHVPAGGFIVLQRATEIAP